MNFPIGMLTAADGEDVYTGTAGDDTFTAELGTLNSGDSIIDNNADDTDELNAQIKGDDADGVTLQNIEEINLNSQALGETTFNAENVTHTNVGGSTITVSNQRAAFGDFTVSNAADNNVTAGDNITDLTVTELTGGTVDAGAAETVSVSGSGDTDGAANVIANGELTLNVSGSATGLNLEATEDSTVDFSGDSVTDIAGSGEGALTLEGDFSGATSVTGVDTVVQDTDATVDASNWEVGTIDLGAEDFSGSLTVADGQNVEISETVSGAGISGDSTNDKDTVNVSSALKNVGTLTFADLATASIELTNEESAELGTLTTAGADTTIGSASDLTIGTLTSGTDEVVLNVAGDVNLSNGSTAESLDASGVAGALQKSYDATNDTQEAAVFSAKNVVVTGGEGDNNVQFSGDSSADDTVDYTGFAGDDTIELGSSGGTSAVSLTGGDNTVNAKALTDGTLAVTTEGGDTTLALKNVSDGTVVVDALGNGNDTISIESNDIGETDIIGTFAGGTNTLELIEADSDTGSDVSKANLQLEGLTDIALGSDATFAVSQLDGKTLNVSNVEDSNNNVLNVGDSTEEAAQTIDLSGLTLENTGGLTSSVVTADVTGGSGDDTITVGTGTFSVEQSKGTDSYTFGAGADTYVADTAKEEIDVISGFDANEDKIDFAAFSAEQEFKDEAAIQTAVDGLAAGSTLDDALTAVADTSEFDATALTAFEFDGNTYVFANDGTDDGYAADSDTVIELTGVDLGLTSANFDLASV